MRYTEHYIDAAGLELIEERFLHQDLIKPLVRRVKAKPNAGRSCDREATGTSASG